MIHAILLLALMAGNTVWEDFANWFSREGKPGAPADVVRSYTVALQARGVSESDAAARGKEVQEYLGAHPREALTLHFNRIYTWKDAPFSREPSAFVRRVASTRSPGRALDIAMGQGRNAVWLAKQGWQVSGYDISDAALREANAAAAAAGLQLETTLASHEEYELGTARWDLIVMSFAFTRLSDQEYMKRVRNSLKPGGVLLVEGFNGGPSKELNLILKAVLEYRVLLFEDLPDVSDWGRMKAPLLRMALERP
ncbi:MAG: class I SAM-dependent methyltransferase [Bryobacterales bacterium]|nr:class I SAM-dependent methyltransferase [Bryobacterales bacterium]